MKIHGIEDLAKAMRKLPEELSRGAEAKVLRAGANPIRKAARSKAPTDSGLLKKSIGTNVKKLGGQRTARVGARVGWGKVVMRDGKEVYSDPTKYSHLVEYGTSKAAAKPFIRPAIDTTKSDVVAAMASKLDQHLTKAVQKVRSRR